MADVEALPAAPVFPEGAATPVPTLPPIPCERCGIFLTPEATAHLFGKTYCTACAARSDVNYLKAYRDAHWGKRDSWAWLYGVVALFEMLTALSVFVLPTESKWGQSAGGASGAAVLVLASVIHALFWLGVKAARPVLLGLAIVVFIDNAIQGGQPNILEIIFAAAVLFSTRNKLFFRIEPTEKQLLKAWRAVHDNRIALWSRGLALIALMSMLSWVGLAHLAAVTLVLSMGSVMTGVVGLKRVNPAATPPVGQRGAALFGIIGGGFSFIATVLFIAYRNVSSY